MIKWGSVTTAKHIPSVNYQCINLFINIGTLNCFFLNYLLGVDIVVRISISCKWSACPSLSTCPYDLLHNRRFGEGKHRKEICMQRYCVHLWNRKNYRVSTSHSNWRQAKLPVTLDRIRIVTTTEMWMICVFQNNSK